MNILALNAGSNSLKFQVVTVQPKENKGGKEDFGRILLTGVYDNIGKEDALFSLLDGKQVQHQENLEIRDHGQAVQLLLDWLDGGKAHPYGIAKLGDIQKIGHRVVHGADRFDGPVRLDDRVMEQIEELQDLAPLHNASALRVMRAAQEKVGSSVPMVAVFDTVFHRTIPDRAALYGLPLQTAERHKIRRYGFHGISHRYLLLRYAQIAKRSPDDLNLITLHLEGGSSAAAIQQGKSVDTSMGFTPLEGLMMGTRSGDLDPAIVPYLMRKENLSGEEVEKLLNKQSGLLGVSGKSADTRELMKQLDNPQVSLALEVFSYRVRKYIGAYLAVLNGVDAIVCAGGIGENTPHVRRLILERMNKCGIEFDRQRNEEVVDYEGIITIPQSPIPVWVIPTEENLMIARETAECE